MEQSTQSQRVLEFLRAPRGESFTAREIAEAHGGPYPDIYTVKAQRDGFINSRRLIQQVISEIGAARQYCRSRSHAGGCGPAAAGLASEHDL